MYKRVFLLFFLLGLFVLEIKYKKSDSQKFSVISFSWTQTFALGPSVYDTNPSQAETSSTAVSADLPEPSAVDKDGEKGEGDNEQIWCASSMSLEAINRKIRELNEYIKNRRSAGEAPTKLDSLSREVGECEDIKQEKEESKKDEEQCREDRKQIEEAGFGKACARFSRGMGCEEAITACSMCPDPDEEAEFNSYNCVAVHQKTKCPLLAGEELKLAKEKRDKFIEEVKEMEEEVNELEKDIVEKQNEINKSLAELEENFTNSVAEFERETENAEEDLEAELNENKVAIKSEVSKQMAQIQEVVDKSLEIAHSFENAYTEANMKYRAEVKKVYEECRFQAKIQLDKYKDRRRQAIESGAYRVSLSSLTSKDRISFALRDKFKSQQYYRECLALRRSDLKSLELTHQQKMRVINQQKEQYQKKMNGLKQKAIALNKMAYEQQNQLVQNYAKRMEKIISQHSKQYQSALKNYQKNKKTLLAETSKINTLQKHLMEKKQILAQKKKELVTEQQLIAYLKSKGVSEESNNDNEEFSSAVGALEDYNSAVALAYESCGCDSVGSGRKKNDSVEKWKVRACNEGGLKGKMDNLTEGNLELVIQKLSPTSGAR